MLSLGFVLLFGGVSPTNVVVSLAVYMIQLRGSAYALVKTMRRPMPRSGSGIGAWKAIVDMLMWGGVLFSACLCVMYASAFKGTPLVTKLSGVIFFCLVMLIVWALIDRVFPPVSSQA